METVVGALRLDRRTGRGRHGRHRRSRCRARRTRGTPRTTTEGEPAGDDRDRARRSSYSELHRDPPCPCSRGCRPRSASHLATIAKPGDNTSSMPTIAIVSGYFNPVHRGHIRMIRHARELADRLIVIVNNDVPQELKKGKMIMPEHERMEVVGALVGVDEVVLSLDQDRTVSKTLEAIASRHPGD